MNSCLSRHAFAVILLSMCLPLFGASPAERPSAAQRASRAESIRNDSRNSGTDEDYVLQPQDVLKVFVFQHDDLNKQSEAISISKEHTINLPLIKTVNLKGKTARQAEEMIRSAYDKDYLVNPQVSVMVLKYAERSVNVGGAVNTAGRILFPQERGLTIVDAISLAGGPSRIADLKRVKLTRRNEDGETVTEVIDVDAMWKSGGRDVQKLQKDDNIFVPERIL
jgi:polysaccharide export outer membrane protein